MKEIAQPRRWGEMKEIAWHDQPRQSRLAAVTYPHLASEETQKEMAALARGEGKRAPGAPKLLADRERGCVSPLGGAQRRR